MALILNFPVKGVYSFIEVKMNSKEILVNMFKNNSTQISGA